MIVLRAIVLMAVVALITPPFSLIAIATAPLPRIVRYRVIARWADIVLWVLRHVCRLDYRVLGSGNLPQRSAVILAKHQSAWETMAFQQIFPPQAYVLKRELLRVPFFGWGLARFPNISIDRGAGKDALTQVLEQGGALLREGLWVVVFPEGTRSAPGTTRRYKGGGAALAAASGAPVVPVAHNAGEFWRKGSFRIRPGTVTVSIGPAIDPSGLTAAEINRRAQDWIEGEMRRLFPHHYAEPAR
ncbi:MAG: 1-acyl-sn-glycerol-3-phosphate acyltransferase [Rhodocyclales bacterium CG17_big_fil_post_rev_8_21_14_2_50_68_7]|nr:MAG: 1-acyl-sn-glycerol-3-phosphate acyltransferase [Rhodocyclales bacterium CG17_big_fil_post_rev_8_21_14_2_50_68_7]PIX75085.1 MAG: 1-acyl-sn-glycerol-3-phosphate acyltransferase [Rhodocyclales bacterium CG_4_10_14_3_um_filter_68_10]